MAAGFNEIREKVYTVVRDSGRNFITEDDVDLWIMEAIEDLTSRLHLNHNSKTQVDSAISTNTIPIPSDYVDLLWLRLGTEDYCTPVDEAVWNSWNNAETTPDNTLVRVFNGNFELYPTPTGTTYLLRYWASSDGTSLTGFTGTLKTKVVNYARAHARLKEGEFTAYREYMGLYETGLPKSDTQGKNRLPGPLSLYVVPGYFESSEYVD